MPRWYVAASIQAAEPMGDSVLARFDGFRPDEDEQCIWVDAADRTRLNATIEIPAPDSGTALQAGREMAHEAAALLGSAASVVEVVTSDVDDEDGAYLRWVPSADGG